MSHVIRRATELALDETTVTALRAALKTTADEVVQAIIDEVPPYANALSGRMGATMRRAVRTALGHYLDLASGNVTGGDGGDAAYELGRGEVRDGRSMDALLGAYRVGARVAWRCLAAGAVPAGLPAAEVAKFAELTFAYIDELSAASAAGHADELAARARAHERHLEPHGSLTGSRKPLPNRVRQAVIHGSRRPGTTTSGNGDADSKPSAGVLRQRASPSGSAWGSSSRSRVKVRPSARGMGSLPVPYLWVWRTTSWA